MRYVVNVLARNYFSIIRMTKRFNELTFDGHDKNENEVLIKGMTIF